jgi:hypothetical protein
MWSSIESAIEDCEFVEREVNGREGDNAWTMLLIRKLIESVVMNDEEKHHIEIFRSIRK